MASIQFRAKPKMFKEHLCVKVPRLTRSHCDMESMRKHPKFGAYANSDLFASVLARAVPFKYIRIDQPPSGVTVDSSGFLAVVTVEV